MEQLKKIFRITGVPVLLASLCCLSPVIVVLLGLSSISFAASLADIFYGEYKWAFRVMGIVALTGSYIYYLRAQKGVCTFDDAVRRRNEIINEAMLVLIAGVLGYIFFLYVVVHYVGVWLSIWK